jgi:hypothetical protein
VDLCDFDFAWVGTMDIKPPSVLRSLALAGVEAVQSEHYWGCTRGLSAYVVTGIVPLAHASTIQYYFKKKSAVVYVQDEHLGRVGRGRVSIPPPLPVPSQPATFSFISLP